MVTVRIFGLMRPVAVDSFDCMKKLHTPKAMRRVMRTHRKITLRAMVYFFQVATGIGSGDSHRPP